MLENVDSNLQTKFGVHITSNIFNNNQILESWDYTPPSESLPDPGGGGRFESFSLKWVERMNLKI